MRLRATTDSRKASAQLLADLYPDNAHFIYELLQNAEDAGAREVTFDLQADGLRVEHDGPRLFDLDDIESITGIGQSTKADDVTRIGKFGVGFKAVFAYTQTPVIHSGEHSFAIHDLFVPVPVPRDGRAGWTTFWFPFDRADKPADRAATEVATALREISRTTLLFLNNIPLSRAHCRTEMNGCSSVVRSTSTSLRSTASTRKRGLPTGTESLVT